MDAIRIGLDLAKNVFSLHGVDANGKVVLRRTVSRAKLVEVLANTPPCLIGMEACSGAHHWARVLRQFGHDVRIMAAQFVAPYRKDGKNDGNDAAAICEAVSRPGMRFVPVKSVEQQAVLVLHRVRKGLCDERTALINQLRGLLTEFGIVLSQGRYHFRRELPAALDDPDNGVPELARGAFREIAARLAMLDEQILAYDRQINGLARQSAAAQQIMAVSGVGALTATATLATIGDARHFKSGRQFAAWLGVTPRQHSTGGKARLGRITKRGDVYLRTLFIHGARAAIATLADKQDRLSCWVRDLIARRGYAKAIVALAARNARIVWALLAKGEPYRLADAP